MSTKNPHTVPGRRGRLSHKRFPKNVKVAKRSLKMGRVVPVRVD
jgi:hypothetical protein